MDRFLIGGSEKNYELLSNNGWQQQGNGLKPISSKTPMIPFEVPKNIIRKCSFDTACSKHCGCSKYQNGVKRLRSIGAELDIFLIVTALFITIWIR